MMSNFPKSQDPSSPPSWCLLSETKFEQFCNRFEKSQIIKKIKHLSPAFLKRLIKIVEAPLRMTMPFEFWVQCTTY